MADRLAFADMPAVLADDEVPFVIALSPDPRPAATYGGAEYRRGGETYTISWPVGGWWLRARVEQMAPGAAAVTASAGPLLADWWPLLLAAPADPARPFLAAGVGRHPINVPLPLSEAPSLPVRILPTSEDVNQTFAAWVVGGEVTDDETIGVLHVASLAVIRAAVQVLLEYGDLVGEPPDVEVRGEHDQHGVSLAEFLRLAGDLARALDSVLRAA